MDALGARSVASLKKALPTLEATVAASEAAALDFFQFAFRYCLVVRLPGPRLGQAISRLLCRRDITGGTLAFKPLTACNPCAFTAVTERRAVPSLSSGAGRKPMATPAGAHVSPMCCCKSTQWVLDTQRAQGMHHLCTSF